MKTATLLRKETKTPREHHELQHEYYKLSEPCQGFPYLLISRADIQMSPSSYELFPEGHLKEMMVFGLMDEDDEYWGGNELCSSKDITESSENILGGLGYGYREKTR